MGRGKNRFGSKGAVPIEARKRFRRWERKELELLKRTYRSTPMARLVDLLGRSMASIASKAKGLGLYRDPAASGRVSPANNPYEKVSREDRIYIAALVDGEGTIAVMQREKGKSLSGKVKTPSRLTIMSVSNTDRGLLEYLQSRLGGQIYSRFTSALGRKPCHTWQIGGSLRCKQVLAILRPYMREEEKKRRADEVISYSTPVERRMGKPALRKHA